MSAYLSPAFVLLAWVLGVAVSTMVGLWLAGWSR